jgi:hypothetical protein
MNLSQLKFLIEPGFKYELGKSAWRGRAELMVDFFKDEIQVWFDDGRKYPLVTREDVDSGSYLSAIWPRLKELISA